MADSSELWWTWYVPGYRDTRLISAKAVCGDDAEFLAELFRKEGMRNVLVRSHSE